ncbi:helix-turn-helix domain-containing protein [Ancylobacter sp. IITR112]|uniref:helix-turn-helix domain-containing protein n=1 Tax=Ancylobacter sp. IITR112 TaxID=3138073 RepID=UPI00352B3F1C
MNVPGFAYLPTAAAMDARLSPMAVRVLLLVATMMDGGFVCEPAVGEIATRAGITRKSARRALGDLIALGYLSVAERFRDDGCRLTNAFAIGRRWYEADDAGFLPYGEPQGHQPGLPFPPGCRLVYDDAGRLVDSSWQAPE